MQGTEKKQKKGGNALSDQEAKVNAGYNAAKLAEEEPSKELRDKRKRLNRLHAVYYGRNLPASGPGAVDPPGGCVEGRCCSHVWADDVWNGVASYPPGGDASPMVRCPGCMADVPPIYLDSSGHCQDCHHEAMPDEISSRLQHSASVIDFHDLCESRR